MSKKLRKAAAYFIIWLLVTSTLVLLIFDNRGIDGILSAFLAAIAIESSCFIFCLIGFWALEQLD